MPTIFVANESSVLVDGQAVEGVQALEYRRQEARANVYAIGSTERIGIISGAAHVEGSLVVASTSQALDRIAAEKPFQISAQLKHGDTHVAVTFDDCFLAGKSFQLGVGNHGEAVYSFTAARVREEQP